MARNALALIITIVIAVLTYCASEEKKAKKAAFAGALAAALSFGGSYFLGQIPKDDKGPRTNMEEYENAGEQQSKQSEERSENINTEDIDTNEDNIEREENVVAESTENVSGAIENNVECVTYMGETHEPSDIATHVEISNWELDKDYDISGHTSEGIRICIYNMFSALDGNNSNILSEIESELHYALNEDEIMKLDKKNRRFVGKFVIGKDTDGSPSTAVISILLDGEEVYNTGEVNCFSLEIPPFDVALEGRKEMIIKIVCQHKGNPFVIGMVNE